MRSQTITARPDGHAELPGTVDPTGWLAGPRAADSTVRESSVTKPAGGDPDVGDGAEDCTERRSTAGRRAGSRRTERSRREARRAARERHLRRVRTGSDQRIAAEQPASLAVPAPAVLEQRTEAPAVQGYRMGRWARLTLTITVLAAAVVIAVSMTAGSAPTALVDVTVAPGDTLWSIAGKAAPDRDPREVIEEIRHLNDVPGSVLPVGVVLRVPTSN